MLKYLNRESPVVNHCFPKDTKILNDKQMRRLPEIANNLVFNQVH